MFDLATAAARTGLDPADPAVAAELAAQLDVAFALVSRYLDHDLPLDPLALPADLEFGMWLTFEAVRQQGQDSTTGGTDAAISSVTLTGVGTVRFAEARGTSDADDAALIPTRARSVLDLHRAMVA